MCLSKKSLGLEAFLAVSGWTVQREEQEVVYVEPHSLSLGELFADAEIRDYSFPDGDQRVVYARNLLWALEISPGPFRDKCIERDPYFLEICLRVLLYNICGLAVLEPMPTLYLAWLSGYTGCALPPQWILEKMRLLLGDTRKKSDFC